MARKSRSARKEAAPAAGRPSALVDTRANRVNRKDKVSRPENDAFFRKQKKVIVALTVREILDEEIARKLA